jgi:hypothetical protein
VLMSVVLHGSAIGFLVRRPTGATATFGIPSVLDTTPVLAQSPAGTPTSSKPGSVARAQPAWTSTNGAAVEAAELPERISLEEFLDLQRVGEQVVLLDVRTPRTFEADPVVATGAVRMPPDEVIRLAKAQNIPWKATLVAYCA